LPSTLSRDAIAERLRITLHLRNRSSLIVDRVALLPKKAR
jgi:hypothetical protein